MPDATHHEHAPLTVSEHSRLLLATHRAMRADGGRLITATQGLQDRDPSDARALSRAFAEVVMLIHDHHWTEDDVMYPFLIERLPGFERDVGQLAGDHIDLDAAMARVTAGLRVLTRSVTPRTWHDTHRRLVDDARAFNRILANHLNREEAAIVTPFDSTISRADQRNLSRAESKLSTYRHIRMAVPWVLANTTAAEASELRKIAPRMIGVFHDHRWQRRFERIMAPLYRTEVAPTRSTRAGASNAA